MLWLTMSTWAYVRSFQAEHQKYLADEGVVTPPVALGNRSPDQADVRAAYEEVQRAVSGLVADAYKDSDDEPPTVALRGPVADVLVFLLALARRCGQLYLAPFPHDAMPGIMADPGDDTERLLGRADQRTREAIETALRDKR
jgi:hypothetical protein